MIYNGLKVSLRCYITIVKESTYNNKFTPLSVTGWTNFLVSLFCFIDFLPWSQQV